MVRTAAETFFYNFNEQKFFLDESKYLRVARKVCTATTPPVDHLRIIDELYRGGQIYMTLYPQKPGTYFGAEICKCQWEPKGCRRRSFGGEDVRVPDSPIEDEKNKKPRESVILGFSGPCNRSSILEGMPGDGAPAELSRSSPEKVLRMKKRVTHLIQTGSNSPPRKSQSSPGEGGFGVNNVTVGGPSHLQQNEPKKEKTLRMKSQLSRYEDDTPPPEMPPPPKKSTDWVPETGKSVSRVTLPPAGAPLETQWTEVERRPATVSQARPMLAKRKTTTWGFLSENIPRSRSQVSPPRSELMRSDSPIRREPSPQKSISKAEDGLPYYCRKCTEKLCLKCRMPVESCCCGIPNFLYCTVCEENIAGSAKNVGDPFKCRKCDMKLCLVCRQHVDCCCCPKPNFFVCRSCETKRRTRCCISLHTH